MSSVARRPVLAIAGATGSLGLHIANTLLEPDILSQLSSVVLLSRKKQEESQQLQEWADKGAKVVVYDENDLAASLAGVDVLINVIGAGGDDFKDRLVEALPQTQVKLYFPSEYGVDHTLHDFQNETWDFKKRHMDLARRAVRDETKICRVFIGLFLEDVIPELGFNVGKNTFASVGSLDTKVSYTSMGDVGKILAIIATMSPEELAKLPETIRLSGTDASMTETAQMMLMATGTAVSLSSVDGPAFKRHTLATGEQNPYPYLRFLMGDGSIDYRAEMAGGLGNDNELINPGGAKFRWRTMGDLVRERYGGT